MTLFTLGHVVMTRGVSASDASDEVLDFITRHAKGDWGDMSPSDKRMNDKGLKPASQDRLMSSYVSKGGTKVWVITEWDRSVTTVLLPDEY